ncbi:exonuclease domain-containing protein [Eudoraea chungangensis]|uniref:exonuclease domain-containing protein n=1 Tax=Eudoraea chungangensis TaxID=1481905 RepID=UPI0023EAEF3F|nr:exonuclease domain-containing protein [Eudoraea chungangensis]
MYAIVDIETTGNGIKGNKITEISIFIFDGKEIVDEYTTLVNPNCEIPYFITGLTGIDNDMVRDAPSFEEVAPKILALLKENIFVAHSVNFDYNVIKEELRRIGQTLALKKLCTVRLSRKLLPGYSSYSLGKLCSSLGIPLTDRHRARGDAAATVLLFKQLLDNPKAEPVFTSFLNARSQEITLPPGLSKSSYESLPNAAGIYYFKNTKGEIIYVGKAKNIKKRVLSHFYDKSKKELKLCEDTSDIDFKLSGNELLALLMESTAIKRHYPLYNRAQKRNVIPYGVFSYEDRQGILHLAYNKQKLAPNPIVTFYNTTDCRLFIEQLCKSFNLCPKYCHLQDTTGPCSHFRIKECKGICRGEEEAENYNSRVINAIKHSLDANVTYLIKDKGRTREEDAVILVKDGTYAGFGFVPKNLELPTIEDVLAFLQPQKNTIETTRLVRTHTLKYPKSVVLLNNR